MMRMTKIMIIMPTCRSIGILWEQFPLNTSFFCFKSDPQDLKKRCQLPISLLHCSFDTIMYLACLDKTGVLEVGHPAGKGVVQVKCKDLQKAAPAVQNLELHL